MTSWLSATCPICRFRYPLTKFKADMNTIEYPLARMTGGGRGKGFHVQEYLLWTTLPTLKQTEAWSSLLHLYNRLAGAYDAYYLTCGFLSPEIKKLMQALQKPYSYAYQTSPLTDYPITYASTESSTDVAETYQESSYADTYARGAILFLER